MISGRSRELGRSSLALAVAVGADRLRDCLRMYPEVSGTAVETTARDDEQERSARLLLLDERSRLLLLA
jgi:hypothetical protein